MRSCLMLNAACGHVLYFRVGFIPYERDKAMDPGIGGFRISRDTRSRVCPAAGRLNGLWIAQSEHHSLARGLLFP